MVDILELAAKGDAVNVARSIRVRALWSPYYFIKVVLHYHDLVEHLHNVELEAFITRELNGIHKQLIEWFRGAFKTTCFTIGLAMWFVLPHSDEDDEYAIEKLGIDEDAWFARMRLHNQNATQLLAFETIENASKKIGEIKWHFEENQLFRALFSEIAWSGSERPWNSKCLKIRRTGSAARHEEGTFEAIGVGGALQSRHYDRIWEDDLVGKRAAESETEMAKTIRWHGLLHGAFVNAAQQRRAVVGNRWGYHDLNSHIREHEPDFNVHSISATYQDGEGVEHATFEERYPLEALNNIRTKGSMTPYDYSCQYNNNPIPEGATEIEVERVHTYKVEPDGLIICSCGYECYASQLWRIMNFDPYNAKGVNSRSCPAITIVGCAPNRHVFLLDYFMLKQGYVEVFEKLYLMNDIWQPSVFTYEDVGNQNMCEFHIKRAQVSEEFKDAGHKRFPSMKGVKTGNVGAENRVRQRLLPIINEGRFAIRNTHHAIRSMLETWPAPMLHHDYDPIDAIEDGVNEWRYPPTHEEEMRSRGDPYAAEKKLGLGVNYTPMRVGA